MHPLNFVPEVSEALTFLPLVPALQVKKALQGKERKSLGQMLFGWSRKLEMVNWPLALATWEPLVTLTRPASVKFWG